jgi:hypothetical protein
MLASLSIKKYDHTRMAESLVLIYDILFQNKYSRTTWRLKDPSSLVAMNFALHS